MKPPQPFQATAEAAGIDVAVLIAFGHAEASEVQTATVIEVEHLVLVHDGMAFADEPKLEPPASTPPTALLPSSW